MGGQLFREARVAIQTTAHLVEAAGEGLGGRASQIQLPLHTHAQN